MRHSVAALAAALVLAAAYDAEAMTTKWFITANEVNVASAPTDSASTPQAAAPAATFAVTGVVSVRGTPTARGQYRHSFDSLDTCNTALKDGTDEAMAAANAHLVAVVAAKLGPDAKVDFTCEAED